MSPAAHASTESKRDVLDVVWFERTVFIDDSIVRYLDSSCAINLGEQAINIISKENTEHTDHAFAKSTAHVRDVNNRSFIREDYRLFAFRDIQSTIHSVVHSNIGYRCAKYEDQELFLRRLLDTSQELDIHVFAEYMASVILKSTYDYDAASRKDKSVDIIANVLAIASPAARPDIAVTVNVFPFSSLRLPPWYPGVSFMREIEMARNATNVYVNRLFENILFGE